jgi:hypothetical protein
VSVDLVFERHDVGVGFALVDERARERIREQLSIGLDLGEDVAVTPSASEVCEFPGHQRNSELLEPSCRVGVVADSADPCFV